MAAPSRTRDRQSDAVGVSPPERLDCAMRGRFAVRAVRKVASGSRGADWSDS